MKKTGNKRSKARGYTKTICPRIMYRKAPVNKTMEVNPIARKIAEWWVIFSSVFTIFVILKYFFG